MALLSNGKYHVLLRHEGTGCTRWSGMAVVRSRGNATFANQVLSAMRHEFGSHVEKPAEGMT